MELRPATVVALAVSLVAPASSMRKRCPYGTRVGMQVTVKSATGLDTAHSVIQTEHTRDDAIKFCREYMGKVAENCIKGELATPLKDLITADCTKGHFHRLSSAIRFNTSEKATRMDRNTCWLTAGPPKFPTTCPEATILAI